MPGLGELAKCSDLAVKQCKSYRIGLLGDPTSNVELRKKYKAALGSACYVSATNTFNCFYKAPQKACQDVLLVPNAQRKLQKVGITWPGSPEIPEEPT